MADVDPFTFVNVHDAKTQFSRLIDRAHAGEEIILAKAGVPWAKIIPYEPSPALLSRKPGRFEGELSGIPDSVWFDPLPDEELDAWDGRHSTML